MAHVMPSLYCSSYSCEQLTFFMYHLDSYAATPVMLRSPKPLIMRDFFLTRPTARLPNPLSFLYSTNFREVFLNLACCWTAIYPLCHTAGIASVFALSILGGFASGFAYLFQTQMSPRKAGQFDCNAASVGSMCAMCAASWSYPELRVPHLKSISTRWVTVPYVAYAFCDEYVVPRVFPSAKGTITLHNWGCVGGIFSGLIFATLFLRTPKDFMKVTRFFRNFENN